jgi:predicted nucleic acid-binding protein
VVRLRDTDQVYAEWRRLVVTYSVSGKPVYDARIVAAMNVHRITHILTFDATGFSRYPGLTILDPLVVAGNLQPEK